MKTLALIIICLLCVSFIAPLKKVEAEKLHDTTKEVISNTIVVIGPGKERQKVEVNDVTKTNKKAGTKAAIKNHPKVPSIIGTVTGKVNFHSAQEVKGGIVSFFKVDDSPSPDQALARKVPYKISKLNSDYTFSVKLPAGSYHMGAMQQKKGRRPGPPRFGEEFIFIYDARKNLRVINSKAGEINELGELKGWTPKEQERDLTNSLVIRGTVTNEKFEPFPGAVVLLKIKINSEKPQFVSNFTKEDGRYEFIVSPGTYFLVAKQGQYMVGRPDPGSYMGAYGQKEAIGAGGGGGRTQASASALSGGKGEVIDNVDIAMFVLPDPKEVKRLTRERVGAQEIEKPEIPVPITR